jgi:flavodoxin
MKALIVYDSRFGNTEQLARAMADAIAGECDAVLVKAPSSFDAGGYDLLIVGGPTEAHRMSATLRASLTGLSRDGLKGIPMATFDTRGRAPAWLTGSAAKGAASRLQKAGCSLALAPESFFVKGGAQSAQGGQYVLADGELERAGTWARRVVASVKRSAQPARV